MAAVGLGQRDSVQFSNSDHQDSHPATVHSNLRFYMKRRFTAILRFLDLNRPSHTLGLHQLVHHHLCMLAIEKFWNTQLWMANVSTLRLTSS